MQQAIIPNFLSEPECQQLIDMARGRVARSQGWNVEDGTETVSNYRTSEHMFLLKGETPLVAGIEQRVAYHTRLPVEHQEAIQVVHYLPGKYYKVHWDYFDPKWAGSASAFARGGNRMVTFMMYLNTIPEGYGGETYFNRAGLSVRPDAGKALMWFNQFSDKTVDQSTSHEGRPPIEPYEKWIATIWIRERTFT